MRSASGKQKRRRLKGVTALLLTGAAGVAPAAFSAALPAVAASTASATNCQTGKGETVVASSSSAVVTRAGSHPSNYVYRGCLFSRGQRSRVFAADSASYPYLIQRVAKIKLAGPYVALAIDNSQKGDTAVSLLVTDLRNGRRRSATAGHDYAASAGDSYTLERVSLSKHGAVAWRGTHIMGYPGTEETIQKVTIADSHGTRVLAGGAPGSLGGPQFSDPRTVAWSQNGVSSGARAFFGLPHS